jgi:hypothetical protein
LLSIQPKHAIRIGIFLVLHPKEVFQGITADKIREVQAEIREE